MTIRLHAIYRYPIKGFSPQSLEKVEIEQGKPLPWDRAFAIENGPCGFDATNPAHLPKNRFLMLMKQPELAALRTAFDPQTGTFTLHHKGELKASGNLFEPDSMADAFAFLENYCEKPMRGKPHLLHAAGHAFTDSRTQDITLINLASVRDLSEKASSDLDPIRFRGNLYIEGATPWQEHEWVGKEIKIGDITFIVRKRTVRCAATNANPVTGKRDQTIPQLLMKHYDHADCGIHLMPQTSGQLHLNDELIL